MSHTELLTRGACCPTCGSSKHAACPPCDTQTPLRNNYFFGKLMDVPDFDVEQSYVVEKFRRHHARLHGTGVVCGLDVLQHPNPACQNRYVLVNPGEALDCCGNEILVIDQETVDLLAFDAVKALAKTPDNKDHVLQLCIRYKECPTEEVPVLYDECGCDDTRCAPNRILETYAFDVLVDPTLPAPVIPNAPSLAWQSTIALSGAQAVIAHTASLRLYAAADQSPSGGLIQQYQLATVAPIAPRTFATAVMAMAISADGKTLYAAVAGATAADPAELHTLDTTTTAAFSTGATSPVDIPSSAGASKISLIVLDDGSVASLTVDSGSANTAIQIWNPAPGNAATIAAALLSPSIGSDGRLYAAAKSANIHHFDPAAASLDPQTIAVGSADVVDFAIGQSTGPDVLVWIEATSKLIRQAKLDGADVKGVALSDTPVAMILSAGSGTAFVMTQGATNASVQSVDLHRLLTSTTDLIGPAIEIGPNGRALALGDKLFASYADGIAVLGIEAMDCGVSLEPHACPACETADCIVLATIVNYRPGYKLLDVSQPASDPAADSTALIARIDNLLGRVVVPSVADLAAAIKCLLNRVGGTGGTGPQGQPGAPGKGIDAVNATFVECTQPGSATLTGTTLNLVIPRGCDGADGNPGESTELDWYLPHICDFSWEHDGKLLYDRVKSDGGLIVTFDTPVMAADLNWHSIEVQAQRGDEQLSNVVMCWCDLNLTGERAITPGHTEELCDSRTYKDGPDADGHITAVRIDIRSAIGRLAPNLQDLPIRVLLNGDFIRGIHHKSGEWRALDADHLPKVDPPAPPDPPQPGVTPQWMQPGDKRYSGDGIEGGTFMSWVTLVRG